MSKHIYKLEKSQELTIANCGLKSGALKNETYNREFNLGCGAVVY